MERSNNADEVEDGNISSYTERRRWQNRLAQRRFRDKNRSKRHTFSETQYQHTEARLPDNTMSGGGFNWPSDDGMTNQFQHMVNLEDLDNNVLPISSGISSGEIQPEENILSGANARWPPDSVGNGEFPLHIISNLRMTDATSETLDSPRSKTSPMLRRDPSLGEQQTSLRIPDLRKEPSENWSWIRVERSDHSQSVIRSQRTKLCGKAGKLIKQLIELVEVGVLLGVLAPNQQLQHSLEDMDEYFRS